MIPSLSFDRRLITEQIDDVVHVLLELTAPPAPPVDRAPLDVVVVLDRSGSMGGAPLAAVTNATAQLLHLAGGNDRIGVVSFDDEVAVVLPLAHQHTSEAASLVRAIRAGGSTNLSGGWLKGLEMLVASPRPDAVARIVVLTDGHANAGLVGIDQLAPLVAGGRTHGITTSVIGFADGYDEQLVAGLADAGGGNDYWCAGPDQAAEVFSAEFGGLASVVAQNVWVSVVATDAVAVVGVLNEFPITETANGLEVALGDAYGSEVRKVVMKFHLRPQQSTDALDVATLTLRWASTVGDIALHTVSIPVTVRVGDGTDPDASPRVTEEVLLLQAAKAQREARDAAEQGDFRRASTLLNATADLLENTAAAPDLILELRIDAASLDAGEWNSAQSKKHFSRSRTAERGRKANFEKPIERDQ